MISAKRMVTVFRQAGGSDQFTNAAGELTDDQLSVVRREIGEEPPLIASVRSLGEWFVLTESHLFVKHTEKLHKIRLDEVESIVQPADGGDFAMGKLHGGELKIQVKGGSTLAIKTESNGPYVALFNLFLYLARVNRNARRPTTNDDRPTTVL